MSVDYTKIQLSSSASSNKVLLAGSGSFGVAALGGAGETYGSATIPHSFGSDKLIFQVSATTNVAGDGRQTILPWASNDNRVITYGSLDSTNLYVYCISSDTSGFGSSARTVTYTYRILIP